MRELLGRVWIGGVMHARYPTATRTPCGIDSTDTVILYGTLTCACCADVAKVWDRIDQKPESELPTGVCTESRASYYRGCRCDGCRAAHSVYMGNWRRGVRFPKKAPPPCGTRTAYGRGCRCDRCRAAQSLYDKGRYRERKQLRLREAV